MRALLLTTAFLCLTGCPQESTPSGGSGAEPTAHPLLAAQCKAGTKTACDELAAKCKDGDQAACDVGDALKKAKRPARKPDSLSASSSAPAPSAAPE